MGGTVFKFFLLIVTMKGHQFLWFLSVFPKIPRNMFLNPINVAMLSFQALITHIFFNENKTLSIYLVLGYWIVGDL